MKPEHSPEAARARLEVIRRSLLLVGLVYVGLHVWVSYRASIESGMLVGAVTLLTLGFGDLYWAVYGAAVETHRPALFAAIMAFASWLSRPWTTTYLLKLGMQSVDWPKADDDDAPLDDVAESGERASGAGGSSDD